jgi:plasmid replication initiation protein
MKNLPIKSKNLMQHNLITNARYEMSALEMDIFFILLSKLKKDDAPKTLYRIYVKEVEDITNRSWNYQQFREATERFGSRVFEIDITADRFLQLWMLASVEYHFGEGYFELEISEKARPYLIELKENFTVYDLYSALSLTSKYAKRIYQLASQWKDIGRKTFLLEDIKEMLHLKDPKGKEPEQYKQIVEFKKYVLEVAKDQINRLTDIELDYRLLKKGRSFKSIEFLIKVKKQRSKTAKNQVNKEENAPISSPTKTIKSVIKSDEIQLYITSHDKLNLLVSLKKITKGEGQDLSEAQLEEYLQSTLAQKYEETMQDLLAKKQRTVQQLAELGITRVDYVNEIVNNRLAEFFRLYYDIQSGKYQSNNPSGYILMSLGLVKGK